MFKRNPEQKLPPGTHSHEASEIAHLGKLYLPAIAVVASTVETVYLVSDLVHGNQVMDEAIAIGRYGFIGTASFTLFNHLQYHFARRSDEIRNNHVTE